MDPSVTQELSSAVEQVGLSVAVLPDGDDGADVSLTWGTRRVELELRRASQLTGLRAQDFVRRRPGRPGVVVADRITSDARSMLTSAGWSWLDLRGHLHLQGDGLLVDTAVTAGERPARTQPVTPIRGRAGLAVAYWLCANPEAGVSPNRLSARLGAAPSTISTATTALADAGLVDEYRRAVLPDSKGVQLLVRVVHRRHLAAKELLDNGDGDRGGRSWQPV